MWLRMKCHVTSSLLLALSLLRRSLADETERLSTTDWANTLGNMLSRSCMYGFGVSGFYSTYDVNKHDRRWQIRCSPAQGVGPHDCRWTYNYVNNLQETIKFDCDTDYYIAGLYSSYDTATDDRRWRIECCKTPGVVLSTCIGTDWVNRMQGTLEFYLPPNYVIHGIYSYHDPEKRDREWRFNICDVSTEETIQMRPLSENREAGGILVT